MKRQVGVDQSLEVIVADGEGHGLPHQRLGLQDDVTLVGSAKVLDMTWDKLGEALEKAGHRLRPHKCKVWAPAYDEQQADEGLPLPLRRLAERVPREIGGVNLLGSSTNVEYETYIGCTQEAQDKAVQLARKKLQAAVENGTWWCSLPGHSTMQSPMRRAHALDYDARILPPDVIRPIAKELEDKVRQTLDKLLSVDLTEEQWVRAGLPVVYGGLALRTPAAPGNLEAAYWASYDMHAAVLPALMRAAGRVAPLPEAEEARRARQVLAQLGAVVDHGARVQMTMEAMEEYKQRPCCDDVAPADLARAKRYQRNSNHYEKEPVASITRSVQHAKLLSRTLQVIEARRAVSLYENLHDYAKVRMLSAGGPGVGQVWTACHTSPCDLLPNAHWVVATLERLGVELARPGATCQLLKKDDEEEKCGALLQEEQHHPHVCKAGKVTMRGHRQLASALARLIRQAGGEADIERYCPELYKVDERSEQGAMRLAIMDVVAHFPGTWKQYNIDITIRCPHAERYERTVVKPAVAAKAGEKEKFKHYGNAVMPVSFETYGRLGARGIEALDRLIAVAAYTRGTSPGARTRWRAQLERAVIFSTADTYLLALGANCPVRLTG